ncbi:MAG: patatin family protein [Pediococcus pentosaceus]|uniref:patatin family protein n=1 Tax=Pediococcus pentosaceus TaxID=1255 RepID=UPI00191A0822|nr:patatin family protein [Pediococcus pentosaceus]MCH4015801.1 patatin family protein [Pediococcus pentosaceus]MCI1471902.1 patatin family protein [Pediococcus pentosaceus]MCI1506621.1 patatin family protein [Pediococcus pentosaceus]MCQ0028817.1 patatin family protein [Pediococcus pentosaceus]MCT3025899.1 patatin family protein [Pediococcus pentosaceus]
MEKAALILEGGALRSFFTSAVLDYFLEKQMDFEYIHGVSAGTMAAMNYISKQKRRSADVNLHFLHDKRYIGFNNLIRNGGIFNLDFLFSPECYDYSPFDYKAYNESKQIFEITATNVSTGKADIFRKTDTDGQEEAVKASASMPLVSDIRVVNHQPYLDGGIADSIPFRRAQELGYEKIVVVLTRDISYRKPENSRAMNRLVKFRYRDFPRFVQAFADRPQQYNRSLAEIERLEREGKIFVIHPQEPVSVSRVERDDKKLMALYEKGTEVIQNQFADLQKYLAQ